jgi:hypothetical protein
MPATSVGLRPTWSLGVEVRFERVELGLPEPSELRDPGVDRCETLPRERVDSVTTSLANPDEPGLAQDPEMTGHAGLAHGRERSTEFTRGPVVAGEEVEHLTPSRVRQSAERVHCCA